MGATETIEPRAPSKPPGRATGRLHRADPERVLDAFTLALPALLGIGLCLYELRTRSLWLDEAATVAIVSQHGAAFGAALAHDGGNMLAYYAFLHVLSSLFGTGALVLRLPSVLFAGVTVAATGTLALRLFGRRTAAWAGVLAAVSLSLVYWGQNARGYAAMVAFVAMSFLCFVALLEPGAGWRSWVAYVVVTTAAVYCGLEAALVIPAQFVLLVWRRDRRAAALAGAAAVILLCLPLAVLAVGRGSGQLFWVPPPSLRVLRQVVQALTSSGLQPNFYTSTGTVLAILTLGVLALGVGGGVWMARRSGPVAAGGALLTISWLLVPGALAALESTVGQSIFQARYLLVSLPAASLLLAGTLADRRLPRGLALVALTALLVLRALALGSAYGVSSEDWRAATAHVTAHTQPGDCIAFYPLDNRQAFRYYLSSPATAPKPILPRLAWSHVRPFVEQYASLSRGALASLPSTCGRVWLVTSHEGRTGGPPASRQNYQRFTGLTGGLGRLYPRTMSRNFGAPGVVTVTLYAR